MSRIKPTWVQIKAKLVGILGTFNTAPYMPFCVCTLTGVLMLCNIFVILFNKFDKYHNFILLHDKHKINGSQAVDVKMSCCKYSTSWQLSSTMAYLAASLR